jgi:hypothetical protein
MTSLQAAPAAPPRGEAASPWIESRGFDLAFFILSPLAGLALLLAYPVGGPAMALAAAALVGGPHYLASYSFYFWGDASRHHRERWIVHFVVPVAIVAAVACVALFEIPGIIIFTVYFWNAWHVARQSCGILSVYRLRGGHSSERHKRIVNAAILSVSLCMALWNLEWYPELHRLLAAPAPALPRLLWIVSAIAAAGSLGALAVSLLERRRAGAAPSLPEWAFLATSLTLFHPYLWVRDANLATVGMLMGHFIQYLAIVWLVNRRKFASAPGTSTPPAFAAMWRDPRLMLGLFALTGSLFLLLQINLMAVTIALVLLHFYLDGVFWAFRRAEVRKVLGPYLTGWRGAGHPSPGPAALNEARPAA